MVSHTSMSTICTITLYDNFCKVTLNDTLCGKNNQLKNKCSSLNARQNGNVDYTCPLFKLFGYEYVINTPPVDLESFLKNLFTKIGIGDRILRSTSMERLTLTYTSIYARQKNKITTQ